LEHRNSKQRNEKNVAIEYEGNMKNRGMENQRKKYRKRRLGHRNEKYRKQELSGFHVLKRHCHTPKFLILGCA